MAPEPLAVRLPIWYPVCQRGEGQTARCYPHPALGRPCTAPVGAEETILEKKQAAVTPGTIS